MRHVPFVLSALALSACGFSANAQQGAGPRTAQTFDVGDFRAISAAGAHDVIVTTGGAPSVRAEGPQKGIERLDIRVEDGTLKIGTRKNATGSWSGNGGKIVVYVTAPRVEAAALAGSGDLSIDRAESDSFKASLAGSGDLKIAALRAGDADFSLAGSGDMEVAGGVGSAKMSLAGSGGMKLGSLQARQAKMSIAGSGGIRANVTEAADVSVAGSGSVKLTGGARCAISKRGSGSVNCS